MTLNKIVSTLARAVALCLLSVVCMPCSGENPGGLPCCCISVGDTVVGVQTDGYASIGDSVARITTAVDSANLSYVVVDDAEKAHKRERRDWSSWSPDSKRAMWLAIVIPGAGQIYNRKYWKLPIVYGGFLGCIYAIRWNNQMLRDYSQAYMDIMDNDPTTESYNQFLHLGNTITEANAERYKDLFRRRKDFYRRYRDLSIFCLIGVYALSVIDAYVDASLSEFDISKDLSMRVQPAVLNDRTSNNPLRSSAVGVQCSINF